jgi:hypothetical protein
MPIQRYFDNGPKEYVANGPKLNKIYKLCRRYSLPYEAAQMVDFCAGGDISVASFLIEIGIQTAEGFEQYTRATSCWVHGSSEETGKNLHRFILDGQHGRSNVESYVSPDCRHYTHVPLPIGYHIIDRPTPGTWNMIKDGPNSGEGTGRRFVPFYEAGFVIGKF